MDDQKADCEWPAQSFETLPRTLPEDCVEYVIYLIDSNLSDLDVREKLRDVHSTATTLTKGLLKDFIWQRESFQLSLQREKDRSLLRGRTNYGDSVEDEWLIVYILRELSKQIPDVWIRVFDTDGEFLLIEAANSLPLWLNPEIADCRVWINGGRLLVIPVENPGGRSRQGQSSHDVIEMHTALTIIESPTAKILHSKRIEEEAFYRLKKYPQQVADSLHHSLIKVPRKLAYVLHDQPAYISPATEAFYLRDPLTSQPLQAHGKNSSVFPPEDFVTMSTRFNKVGFAQLKSQRFPAPTSWAGASLSKGDAKAKARAELGMKITCGFEMLMSELQNRDHKAYREISMLLEDVDTGDARLPSDDEIRSWSKREDVESWLDINFEDLEKELNGEKGEDELNKGFGDPGAQANLRKMVSRFEDFLNDDEAGVDGVECMDEMDHDDDSSEVSASEESIDSDGESKGLSYEEDDFTAMMREMMGMPSNVMKEMMGDAQSPQTKDPLHADTRATSFDNGNVVANNATRRSGVIDSEDEEILESMDQIEQELRASGALDLEHKDNSGISALPHKDAIDLGSSSLVESNAQAAREDSADHEIPDDVNTNLVKNMLESFKSQGGSAGPGGNLMGLMGMHLPRDEDDGD